MSEEKVKKVVHLPKVKKFNSVVICPSNNSKLPVCFDPSLNGHDFFSKTITCSCLDSADDQNHKCNSGEDGCRRTRKNEYARQQMKKYREKLKQDPVRYTKYLQSERERNARRKLRKVQKILAEDNNSLSSEQLKKLQKRHQNLLNRARLRFGQEYLVDIKNTQPQSNDSLSSTNNEFLDEIKPKRNKTYINRKKKKSDLKNNNEVKRNEEFKDNNESDNSIKVDEELSNEYSVTTPKSDNSELPSLHFFSSLFNNGKINKNKTTVYEIGKGIGPFTNLKIINNNEFDSKECIIPETEFKQEDTCEIKDEPISDPDNDNSISHDMDFNMEEDDSLSDTDTPDDNDFTFNRICSIVNCPSRFMCKPDIKYYPFPPQKEIRECWFNLIKTKTNQWIVDPDAFVCSLHFAPAWFQNSPSYGNKMLLLNAVPTIFPNGTASQFDLDIPTIKKDDYHNSEKFKNYYEWSCMKLREQENLLKNQQVMVENQSEYKIIQTKRIEKLYKIVDEFKRTLKISSSSCDDEITNFLEKIDDMKTDLLS